MTDRQTDRWMEYVDIIHSVPVSLRLRRREAGKSHPHRRLYLYIIFNQLHWTQSATPCSQPCVSLVLVPCGCCDKRPQAQWKLKHRSTLTVLEAPKPEMGPPGLLAALYPHRPTQAAPGSPRTSHAHAEAEPQPPLSLTSLQHVAQVGSWLTSWLTVGLKGRKR